MDLDLLHRFGVLTASRSWLEVPAADKDALELRVQQADSWTDLTPEDQAQIRAGMLEVADGVSPTLQNPADWGDVTAIDLALDSGDLEALDRALSTVGKGHGVEWTDATPAETDPFAAGEEKALPLEDDGLSEDGVELDELDDDVWVSGA